MRQVESGASDSVVVSGSDELDPQQVQGVKWLRQFFGLLERLHGAGCERDRAGNRQLHFNQYAGLVLLGLFNPTLQSLRGLSQASALKKVQQAIGGGRVSMGSLSESVRVFDPELLLPIVEELRKRVPTTSRGRSFGDLPLQLVQSLVAADGSALRVLPQLIGAQHGCGKWRMHVQFEIWNGLPDTAVMTPDHVGPGVDERDVLGRNLRPGKTYLLDRGYERHRLFQQIVDAGSDYVVRVQERPVQVLESRLLTDADRSAGVERDELIEVGKPRRKADGLSHPVRRLLIQHGPRTPSWKGHVRHQEVFLLTNMIDVPAEVVAAVYRLRWQIELFFRFFKHVLGCRKLLSTKSQGATIQVYCALIAALLLAITLGRNITRRGFELIQLYFQGWATEDELLTSLAKLRPKDQKT